MIIAIIEVLAPEITRIAAATIIAKPYEINFINRESLFDKYLHMYTNQKYRIIPIVFGFNETALLYCGSIDSKRWEYILYFPKEIMIILKRHNIRNVILCCFSCDNLISEKSPKDNNKQDCVIIEPKPEPLAREHTSPQITATIDIKIHEDVCPCVRDNRILRATKVTKKAINKSKLSATMALPILK